MATLYWYGGSGNWSSATGHWSTNSGNSPAADHIAPVAGDTVITDTLSNATAYTITIDTAAVCVAATFGAPLAGNLTITTDANTTRTLTLGGNVTITGTPTIQGQSATNRLYILSSVRGTSRTITVTGATIAGGNFDLQDILFANGGSNLDLSGLAGTVGDAGGNGMSGGGTLTLTTSQTQYWTADASASDNWSDATNWDASDHSTAQRVPLPQDDVIFDAGSFAADGKTVVADMPRLGKSIDFSAIDQSMTWTTSTIASIFGSLTLDDNVILTASTQAYTFEGRGIYTLTSAGKTWAKYFTLNAPGGTLRLGDSLVTTSTTAMYVTNGTFDASNGGTASFSFTAGGLSLAVGGTLTLGSSASTITMTGSAGTVVSSTLGTINAGASTLKFTGSTNDVITCAFGGKTWNNIWFSRGTSTGNISITGSSTFADFKDDGTAAHSLVFTKSTSQNVATFTVNGAGGGGSVRTIIDTADGAGTATLHTTGASYISCDWLDIRRSTVDASPVWYAGANSLNTASNTNWIFSAPTGTTTSHGNLSLLGIG